MSEEGSAPDPQALGLDGFCLNWRGFLWLLLGGQWLCLNRAGSY